MTNKETLRNLILLNIMLRDQTQSPQLKLKYNWAIMRLQQEYALKYSDQSHYYGA